MRILITGGAGFIGSAGIRYLMTQTKTTVMNVDKLTYASQLSALDAFNQSDRYHFIKQDICDLAQMKRLLMAFQPDGVMHLAAETHVDRSIHDPASFVQTNVVGTYVLLEAARAYWQTLSDTRRARFRFHHVSTDEVYGDLGQTDALFTETTPYAPSSPYSASKASSDHFVKAWYRTYGLPVLITHCSNNYGPYQYAEKLIPLTITRALIGKPLPLYGDGKQIRDWLYVDDHVRALYLVLCQGAVGATYNISGCHELENRTVMESICAVLEGLAPDKPLGVTHYSDLITYVHDRPGHDRRYAIDSTKIQCELGWYPQETFESGLYKTVQWYLQHVKCEKAQPALVDEEIFI